MEFINSEMVNIVKLFGKKINVWIVVDYSESAKAKIMGVDCIILNFTEWNHTNVN
ncbi:hypothetical protein J7J58_06060 [candidate division WOR-3 bacterium]|nr:hypothetical protein [candidate division WOR-3 bacterium]